VTRTGWTWLGAIGALITAYATYRAVTADVVPGGLAAGRSASEFDPAALAAGTQVELEHTSSRRVARKIAMDHLVEDPRYYDKLKAAGL